MKKTLVTVAASVAVVGVASVAAAALTPIVKESFKKNGGRAETMIFQIKGKLSDVLARFASSVRKLVHTPF